MKPWWTRDDAVDLVLDAFERATDEELEAMRLSLDRDPVVVAGLMKKGKPKPKPPKPY